MFAYIEEECLVRFATHCEEVIFHRSWSFYPSIIFAATVEQGQGSRKPVFTFGQLLGLSFDLSLGHSREGGKQIDRRFLALVLDCHVLSIEQDSCPPFLVILGGVVKDRDEVVLSKLKSLGSGARANRCQSSFPESLCGWNNAG